MIHLVTDCYRIESLQYNKDTYVLFNYTGAAYLTVFVLLCSPPAVKYERIKFLVIALKNSVEIYAWAPKPYHKFMAFKVRCVRMC